jgi:hypothetical protein
MTQDEPFQGLKPVLSGDSMSRLKPRPTNLAARTGQKVTIKTKLEAGSITQADPALTH